MKRYNRIFFKSERKFSFFMKDALSVLAWLVFWFVAALSCLAAVLVVYADVALFPETYLTEYGLVEWVQEGLLWVTGSGYAVLAYRYRSQGLWLVGGFLLCMLVREFDLFFDQWFFHGSWKYFAMVLAVLFIGIALKGGFKAMWISLAKYVLNPSFVWMFCGMVVVLIFSRLIGMSEFWESVLHEGYQYEIKRIVEETVELWGYFLIFLSGVTFRREPSQRISNLLFANQIS